MENQPISLLSDEICEINWNPNGMCGVPAIALVCAETTSMVDPDSRCSRDSPTQAITFRPWERA